MRFDRRTDPKTGMVEVTMTFESRRQRKLLDAALAKAKAELGTDDDAEALVHIAKQVLEQDPGEAARRAKVACTGTYCERGLHPRGRARGSDRDREASVPADGPRGMR